MTYWITGSSFNWDDMFQSLGNPWFKDDVVYCFYDKYRQPLYVGKSINFFQRMKKHRQKSYWKEVESIGLRQYGSEAEMDLAEVYWIQKKHPPMNTEDNHQGKFSYITIKDTSDEFVFNKQELFDRAQQYDKDHSQVSFSSYMQLCCNDFDVDYTPDKRLR